MPRIPSREEPYHSVAKCNRHWKTKREFVTKAANKASHVDGSQYLLICVAPKGTVEVYASEHFHDDTQQHRTDGVINWDLLKQRSEHIQGKNEARWQEVERQEKRFGLEGDEEDGDEDGEEGDTSISTDVSGLGDLKGDPGLAAAAAAAGAIPGQGHLMASFSAAQAKTPARPVSTITITPDTLERQYCNRFEHLGQIVCANILKAWIKVVEPKKQTKYPYKDKKGNEGRPPPWWPRGLRHIEPDHLHKDERPRLLASILQLATQARAEGSKSAQPGVAGAASRQAADPRGELTISRLHFATAEIGSCIPPRQHYELRQIYLIAKEVRKAAEDSIKERRNAAARQGRLLTPDQDKAAAGMWSEVTVEFFEAPPGAPIVGIKRGSEVLEMMPTGKENVGYDTPSVKRGKLGVFGMPVGNILSPSDVHHHAALTPLHNNVYVTQHYQLDNQGQSPHSSHTPAPHAGQVSGYTNWQGSNLALSHPSQQTQAQAQHLNAQQQAYYQHSVSQAFVTDMHYAPGTPAYHGNGGAQPAQGQAPTGVTGATTPQPTGTPNPYPGAQQYVQVPYQGGAYGSQYGQPGTAGSATSGGAASASTGYQSHGPYAGYDSSQGFVGDLAGIGAG